MGVDKQPRDHTSPLSDTPPTHDAPPSDETPPPNVCFGCGAANTAGMHLVFERDDVARRVRGRFRLSARYQGAPGMIHGGIIAVLLDEALGKACRFHDVRAVTAELAVEYLRPVKVDEEISVEAFVHERKERNLFVEGEIRDVAGRVLARGRGRFVIVDPERYRRAAGLAGLETPQATGKA
jgi:uncharacterized protein (TIGR00369 family)